MHRNEASPYILPDTRGRDSPSLSQISSESSVASGKWYVLIHGNLLLNASPFIHSHMGE